LPVRDELHRRDALEVVRIEPDRTTRGEIGLVAGGGGERLERRSQEVAARHSVALAQLLERAAQRAIHERVEDHDAAAGSHAAVVRDQVLDGGHARMPHDGRAVTRELGLRGARDARRRVAGRVGDEVDLDRRPGHCHARHRLRIAGRRQRRTDASSSRS
jgi:hypothetical protein